VSVMFMSFCDETPYISVTNFRKNTTLPSSGY